MTQMNKNLSIWFVSVFLLAVNIIQPVYSATQHGIAMYGVPALPEDFISLPYVNINAPKGGRIVFGERGGFDSLNPYILKGRAPWGVRAHTVESLMGRNWNEPFTLYGLLAETIETALDRTWVEFTLRKEARFSDNSPVTVEDVLWTFTTMGELGHPRYQRSWENVESAVQTGPRSLRITFKEIDFEAPLIMGLRPVLKKADWDGRAFDESSLSKFHGSGAYVIDDFEAGRFISFKRNADYWGKDLPFNRGQNNIDEIRYDYFADGDVIFQAFQAGETSVFREWNAKKWQNSYNFPAVQNGDIVKSLIPHQRPTGMNGFVFNTRRDIFKDWRVREALILAFNYDFINKTINNGKELRITSYFSNSVLGMQPGVAKGRVAQFLQPFTANLLPGTLEGYSLPVFNDTQANRANIRQARKLLQAAGWSVIDGVLKNQKGKVFSFDILLNTGSAENEAIANIYRDALKALAIKAQIILIDAAQYKERLNTYNFDMTPYRRGLSLSPGTEQKAYWGSRGVSEPGSRNYMGINSEAADAMIIQLLTSETQDDFIAAARALDRILMAGRYVIPFWSAPGLLSQLAHKKELQYPKNLPIYGDWIGFMPNVWWVDN